MSLRVSQIHLQVVLLDEFDAPRPTDAVTFSGDAQATAWEKAAVWIAELPDRVQELQTVAQEDG